MKEKCNFCKEYKDFDKFSKHPTGYYGLQSDCRDCRNKKSRERNKTPNGVVATMYFSQRQSSRNRNHPYPDYSLDELRNWVFSQSNWKELYDNWVESGYDKMAKPSCDRTDDFKPYSLDRLRLVTWLDNKLKGEEERRAGGIDRRNHVAVIGTCVETGERKRFSSMKEVDNDGFSYKCVWLCCKGKNKVHKGYTWEYA